MACKNCGAELPADAAFCSKCGSQVGIGINTAPRPAMATRIQPAVGQGAPGSDSEEDVWTGAYSPKAMAGPYALAGLLTIAVIALAIYAQAGATMWIAIGIGVLLVFGYLALLMLYRRISISYRLTNHRLVIHTGIINSKDDRILLVDVDDIGVTRNILEKIGRVGTVTVYTTDETVKEESPDPGNPSRGRIRMKGIENPSQVGELIDEKRRAERTRRGVYMMNA